MEEIPTVRQDYTPTEQDREHAKIVTEVIDSLSTRIKSGEIDSKTREIIEDQFFDSMQECLDEYMDERIDLEALNRKPFVTLFEAALLIGSRVNNDCQECLLTYSAGLFSDAFLRGEIDP